MNCPQSNSQLQGDRSDKRESVLGDIMGGLVDAHTKAYGEVSRALNHEFFTHTVPDLRKISNRAGHGETLARADEYFGSHASEDLAANRSFHAFYSKLAARAAGAEIISPDSPSINFEALFDYTITAWEILKIDFSETEIAVELSRLSIDQIAEGVRSLRRHDMGQYSVSYGEHSKSSVRVPTRTSKDDRGIDIDLITLPGISEPYPAHLRLPVDGNSAGGKLFRIVELYELKEPVKEAFLTTRKLLSGVVENPLSLVRCERSIAESLRHLTALLNASSANLDRHGKELFFSAVDALEAAVVQIRKIAADYLPKFVQKEIAERDHRQRIPGVTLSHEEIAVFSDCIRHGASRRNELAALVTRYITDPRPGASELGVWVANIARACCSDYSHADELNFVWANEELRKDRAEFLFCVNYKEFHSIADEVSARARAAEALTPEDLCWRVGGYIAESDMIEWSPPGMRAILDTARARCEPLAFFEALDRYISYIRKQAEEVRERIFSDGPNETRTYWLGRYEAVINAWDRALPVAAQTLAAKITKGVSKEDSSHLERLVLRLSDCRLSEREKAAVQLRIGCRRYSISDDVARKLSEAFLASPAAAA